MYEYSNKKANETYTDDEFYYVHQGQIDIFNFSRKPGTDSKILIDEHVLAMRLRNSYLDVITKGSFVPLKSDNERIFAFQRIYKDKSIVVIINRNLVNSENVNIKVKKISKKSKINFIKDIDSGKLVKSTYTAKMRPASIVIFSIN